MARAWAWLRVFFQTGNDPIGDTMTPDRKVTAGGLAGALAVIVAWAVEEFGGVTLPPAIVAAGTTVLTFGTSYFVRNP